MENLKEYKIINAYIFNPAANSVKARCELTYCNNSENCDIFKKGYCVNRKEFLGYTRCPHSRSKTFEGFTKKARKFYSWQDDRKEEYKEVLNKVGNGYGKAGICGDYVYLPYSHLENYVNSLDFIVNKYFCKIEDFTVDNMVKIITYNPRALMGGIINTFQSDEVPKFIQHLKEEIPEKYGELMKNRPDLMAKYKEIAENFVGRIAYIKTLKVGAEIEDRSTFVWDGEKLISDNYNSPFLPFGIKKGKLELIPEDDNTIKITSNSQVDGNTKYKN